MSDKRGVRKDAEFADEAMVSRAYEELKQAVPPAHLDEKILAEARRTAADPGNVVIEIQSWRKWTMPVALAATVVFAVPLVIRVFETGPTQFDIGQNNIEARQTETTVVTRSDNADSSNYNRGVSGDLDAGKSIGYAVAPGRAPSPPARPEYDSVDQPSDFRVETETVVAVREHRQSPAVAAEAIRPATDEAVNSRLSAPVPGDVPETIAQNDQTSNSALPSSLADDRHESGNIQARERVSEQKSASRSNRLQLADANSAQRFDAKESDNFAGPSEELVAHRTASAPTGQVSAYGVQLEPESWLDNIADLYRQGQIENSRRDLGTFLTVNPGYRLADDFPLRASDAMYDDSVPASGSIVPDAATWLRGIGLMARRGETDIARTQLARFFRIYPDYPLPADFPLTRADALPIER